MVVKTPWQFGDRSSRDQPDDVTLPMLRVEHPASRIGDPASLKLRGVSRLSSRGSHKDDIMLLPDIPSHADVIIGEDRSQIRIPIFGNAANMSVRSESRSTTRSQSAMNGGDSEKKKNDNIASTTELQQLLREKMKTGYFSMKNLFESYDSKEKSSVSRQDLHRILSKFLGMSITYSQFNRLMKRYGFNEKSMISYDEFYKKVRQPVKKEDSQSEYPSWFFTREDEDNNESYQSANAVLNQLKNQAQKNLTELLVTLQLEGKDNVTRRIFEDTLSTNGYHLKSFEFEKLWRKLDSKNGELIPMKLFCDRILTTDFSHTKEKSPRRRDVSTENWLNKTTNEGYRDMYHAFSEFANKHDLVTKEHFLMVLADYGLYLRSQDFENFCARCNLQVQNNDSVNFKEFLKFFNNNNNSTKSHVTAKDERCRSVTSSLSSIENRLWFMFGKNYIQLLDKFRKLDRQGCQTLSKIQFRAGLESVLSFNIDEEDFQNLIANVPKDANGEIKYVEFLRNLRKSPSLDTCSSVDDEEDDRFQLTGGRAVSQNGSSCSTSMSFLMDGCFDDRNMDQLSLLIKDKIRQNFQRIEKIFHDLDVKNTKRMNKEMLRKILYKIGLKISSTECDMVWETLLTDQNGSLEFQHFIRHFSHSIKSAAFPNSKKNPPVRGDSDFRVLSMRFNSWKTLIQDFARADLENNYAVLKTRFEQIDEEQHGFVTIREFKSILESVCRELTPSELEIIVEKFSSSQKIFWPEFLKQLRQVRINSRQRHNMKDIMQHATPTELYAINE
ncbi:EF-hand calcium-binding domain-containing protein 6-like [Clytia hemisphaerica]|uniref:EF-hand domain-containing protein n=1 Tax=Clytia hemisphaerica TaxID=252671 RepID=A0A7M6DNR0_9CNID